jgi:hypothetical protein
MEDRGPDWSDEFDVEGLMIACKKCGRIYDAT